MCVALAALFVARFVLAPLPLEAPQVLLPGMPLAADLTRLSSEIPWLAASLAAIFVIWTLVIIVQLSVKYAPVTSRNYLPPQIFLIASGGIVVSGEALASVMAAWLLVLAIRQFVFSLHKDFRFEECFRAGLYLGIIPLLYAPAAVVVVVMAPVALSIFRRSFREVIVCAVGLFLSVPIAGYIYWAMGAPADFIYRELWRCASQAPITPYYMQIPQSLGLIAIGVLSLALVGVIGMLSHKKGTRKTPYKYISSVSFVLLLLIGSAAIPGTSPTIVPLVAVAVALTIPYAFSGRWAVISTMLYCLTVACILALDLAPIIFF